jgi:glycosyltransferase involved in cell wall biosynthesis
MMPARVSVLLPAWNAARTIQACLRSIQRQSETDWECVVVDDGSTDATAAVVTSFAQQDRRIRLIAGERRGLVSTLNEGLEHCRAPLVARMDADDLMHRERLARQIEALAADSTLAGVGCHVRLFPRRTISTRRREYEAWLNSLTTAEQVARDAYVECPVAHPTLMMRREMAQLNYCDEGWPEDYDLVLRALSRGLRIGMVPRRLLSWRDRPDRLSRTDQRYGVARFTACKAHYLARQFLAGTDQYVLWGYGSTGRTLRQELARHHKTPSHIIEVKSSRIGQRIHGAPVVPLSSLAALRGQPIVVSVARDGPRQQIRQELSSHGFVEGRDYVCAA